MSAKIICLNLRGIYNVAADSELNLARIIYFPSSTPTFALVSNRIDTGFFSNQISDSASTEYDFDSMTTTLPEGGFCCNVCAHVVKKRPADMKRHIEHMHCPQRLKCPLCDKVYKTESCRQIHVRKHHNLCLTGREIRDMEANP